MRADHKYIVNLTRESIICDRARVADHPLERMRGLLGRPSLAPGEGLLLTPAPSIHTAFMRFPIDVVFLNNHLHVLRLVERLAPWRATWTRRARAALELASGEAFRRGIHVGDVLAVIDERDQVEAVAHAPGAGDGRARQDPGQRRHHTVSPPRVLLITADSRFRTIASRFLSRRGCWVTSDGRMTNVAHLAHRARADVVILDASMSLRAAAREAGAVHALEPRVGVVLVAEEAAQELAMLVLGKWDSLDALYSAVEEERAHLSRRYI